MCHARAREIDGCDDRSMARPILDAVGMAFVLASGFLVGSPPRPIPAPLDASRKIVFQKECSAGGANRIGRWASDSTSPRQFRMLWQAIAGDGDRATGPGLFFGTPLAGNTPTPALRIILVFSTHASLGFACMAKRLAWVCGWLQLAPTRRNTGCQHSRAPKSQLQKLRVALQKSATLSLRKPDS